jgi:hypothetical protein
MPAESPRRKPAKPARAGQPAKPARAGQPARASQPAKPARTTGQSGKPDRAAQPGRPAKPAGTVGRSSQPARTAQPGRSATPAKPARSAGAAQVGSPARSASPQRPVTPTGGRPQRAERPDRPAAPRQPRGRSDERSAGRPGGSGARRSTGAPRDTTDRRPDRPRTTGGAHPARDPNAAHAPRPAVSGGRPSRPATSDERPRRPRPPVPRSGDGAAPRPASRSDGGAPRPPASRTPSSLDRTPGAPPRSDRTPRTPASRAGAPVRPGRPAGAPPRRPSADERAARPPRPTGPALPPDADPRLLPGDARRDLRALLPATADTVAAHLVAAGQLLDEDPAAAYEHAKFAKSLAGRIGSVREAAGVTAYAAGDYAAALTDLKAARRITGLPDHLPLVADCERALGRPERALDVANDPERASLDRAAQVELKIVVSGARRDLGQPDAAVLALQGPELDSDAVEPWTLRLWYAYADALLAAGRTDDAVTWFTAAATVDDEGETDAEERLAALSRPAEG